MPIVIDVASPDGNVFCIISQVKSVLKQLNRSDEIKSVSKRMMSGNYDQALQIASDVTNELVVFTNSNDTGDYDEDDFVRYMPKLPEVKRNYGDW